MIQRIDTRELFAQSLHELAETQSVDKITVKEIAANCSATPTTFYRYFRSKYELISWVYDSKVQMATDGFGDGCDWRNTVLRYIRIMTDDRSFYLNALRNTAGKDEFHALSRTNDIVIIKRRLLELNDLDSFDEKMDFMVSMYIYGVSEAIITWFVSDRTISDERVADWCVEGMPEVLKPLFHIEP